MMEEMRDFRTVAKLFVERKKGGKLSTELPNDELAPVLLNDGDIAVSNTRNDSEKERESNIKLMVLRSGSLKQRKKIDSGRKEIFVKIQKSLEAINQPNYMANATSFDDNILSDGSEAGAVLSVAAAIMNAVVLRTMIKHRATLLALQPDASRLVAIIITMSLLLALQYAAMHIADAAAIADSIGTLPDILLASASFTTLTVIFSANMLLAFTKYFRIRYDRRLPLTVIKLTFAAGFTFSVFFIASFVPTVNYIP
ncbi:UNVERIFIED_CONTAM: hypothetical protein HDU68_001510 [Siphonaria sp. JEL0065]|nr:hypothetical protein HDU68_001510 [Siphonaria sp. JEL0065]